MARGLGSLSSDHALVSRSFDRKCNSYDNHYTTKQATTYYNADDENPDENWRVKVTVKLTFYLVV